MAIQYGNLSVYKQFNESVVDYLKEKETTKNIPDKASTDVAKVDPSLNDNFTKNINVLLTTGKFDSVKIDKSKLGDIEKSIGDKVDSGLVRDLASNYVKNKGFTLDAKTIENIRITMINDLAKSLVENTLTVKEKTFIKQLLNKYCRNSGKNLKLKDALNKILNKSTLEELLKLIKCLQDPTVLLAIAKDVISEETDPNIAKAAVDVMVKKEAPSEVVKGIFESAVLAPAVKSSLKASESMFKDFILNPETKQSGKEETLTGINTKTSGVSINTDISNDFAEITGLVMKNKSKGTTKSLDLNSKIGIIKGVRLKGDFEGTYIKKKNTTYNKPVIEDTFITSIG